MLRGLNAIFHKNAIYSSKTVTRFRNTTARKAAKRNRTVNPGVNLQMRVLAQTQPPGTNVDLEDLEADFTHLQTTHREHVEQSKAIKEREKYLIVGQKYFKEKHPNFLTWGDKQQIRYLHDTDPEEWTLEKLSNGFPALPETILKIVKSSWTKRNISKIKNHDASVQRNWEAFKKGELELPKDLTEHLNKFCDRKLNLEPVKVTEKSPAARVEGEFSEIIKSYERLKNKNKGVDAGGRESPESDEAFNSTEKPKKETYTLVPPEGYKDKKLVTLDKLRSGIEEKVERGNELTVDDQLILKQNKISITAEEDYIIDIGQLKNSNHLQTKIKSRRDYRHLIYPEKISIPKDKYKKGYTYKLNDCFYDSKGYFLYRVPGMEN